MAVYERSFEPYDGVVTPPQLRFLVLARYALRDLFRSKLFVVFLTLCFVFPLFAAVRGAGTDLSLWDALGALLFTGGFLCESIGDRQLRRFKADPSNRGRLLDRGLWRYTRHPNYFGDFCIWWAFYLFAVAAGGWWTVISPLLMSFLLLKVSGVAMLEKTIGERRPDYASYIRRTNAFFPGMPRATVSSGRAVASNGGEQS